MAISEKMRNVIEEDLRLLPEPRAAIIPALHMFQNEYRSLSDENIDEIAQILGLPPMEIKQVATFLHYFFYDRPMGERVIMICDTLSCSMQGGDNLKAYLQRRLEINNGETTKDGREARRDPSTGWPKTMARARRTRAAADDRRNPPAWPAAAFH